MTVQCTWSEGRVDVGDGGVPVPGPVGPAVGGDGALGGLERLGVRTGRLGDVCDRLEWLKVHGGIEGGGGVAAVARLAPENASEARITAVQHRFSPFSNPAAWASL